MHASMHVQDSTCTCVRAASSRATTTADLDLLLLRARSSVCCTCARVLGAVWCIACTHTHTHLHARQPIVALRIVALHGDAAAVDQTPGAAASPAALPTPPTESDQPPSIASERPVSAATVLCFGERGAPLCAAAPAARGNGVIMVCHVCEAWIASHQPRNDGPASGTTQFRRATVKHNDTRRSCVIFDRFQANDCVLQLHMKIELQMHEKHGHRPL
jgi:hypothetical protein